LRWASVADLDFQRGATLHGMQGVKAVASRATDRAYGSFLPIRFPKRRSSARTYGASPAAELTRLRRKTDIKAGKGRRRVGVRGRLKGGC
jgi:hypothetical protein